MRPFPVVTPAILDRAEQLSHERQQRTLDRVQARETAHQIRDALGIAKSGGTARSLRDWAAGLNYSSPEGGAWFWAHTTLNPATSTHISNEFVTQAHALSHNAAHPDTPMTTLADTTGGQQLVEFGIGDPSLDRALDISRQESRSVWVAASIAYAKTCRGRVFVMAPYKHPWIVLTEDEIAELRRNPRTPSAVFITYEHGRTRYLPHQLRPTGRLDTGWNTEARPRTLSTPGNPTGTSPRVSGARSRHSL